MAIFTGICSELAVTSSWAVIWEHAAPAIARTPLVDLLPPRSQVLHHRPVTLGVHGQQHLLDDLAAVAGDPHVGDAHLAQLGRVDVDVDDLGVGGEGADLAGDAVVESCAEA